MLGTGICSGYFLIRDPMPGGPDPIGKAIAAIEVIGLVVAVGSGAAAWRLVLWLEATGKRPRVDASAHGDGDSARR
jgi:hypothetical protein